MEFKTVTIVLKIAEFVSLLIATATVGHFMKEIRDENESLSLDPYDLGRYGRLEFFLFTTSVGMIIVMVVFSLVITGLLKKINGTQAMITIHAIWTLLLLVSSALVAKIVSTSDKKIGRISICDILDENDADYQCSHLIAGVVFGFVAMVLFLLDSGIYIFTYITPQDSPSQHSTGGKSPVAGPTVEAKTNPVTVHT